MTPSDRRQAPAFRSFLAVAGWLVTTWSLTAYGYTIIQLPLITHTWFIAPSADGRYVGFDHQKPSDFEGNFTQVFVYDRATDTKEMVSVDDAGHEGNAASFFSAISADGNFVVFLSLASNLGAPVACNPFECLGLFVHDRAAGTTERVSVNNSGAAANPDVFYWSAISADGRYVAFISNASNMVPTGTCPAPPNCYGVFVRDRVAGTTELASVDSTGNPANRGSGRSGVALSPDGRYVAFNSYASNLVAGGSPLCANGEFPCGQIFVHDRQTGTTERVSVDSNGQPGNAESVFPAISADGRVVAFNSEAANLVADDTNSAQDTFVHDRVTGATERVSVDSNGQQGNRESHDWPAISGDGRYVAFTSTASNLVPGDTDACQSFPEPGSCPDIFIRDRATGATDRVSVSQTPQGIADSMGPRITPDGASITFYSGVSTPSGAAPVARAAVAAQTTATTQVIYSVATDCGRAVCGDGVTAYGCEQCDDGNQVDGDGCSSTCRSELIPGGKSRTDCTHEWLASPVPGPDRNGLPAAQLVCKDDDPACDFGPPGDKACTFKVALCLNEPEQRFACAARDVARVQLTHPRENNPGADVATRDALEAALAGLGGAVRGLCTNSGKTHGRPCQAASDCDTAPGSGNGRCKGRLVAFSPPLNAPHACTSAASITVPLKRMSAQFRKGATTLRLTASPSNNPITGAKRTSDMDALRLICNP